MKRDNHEQYYRFVVKQTKRFRVWCLSCDCRQIHQDDAIYTKTIITADLIEILFEHVIFESILRKNRIWSKISFYRAYWSDICYHMKTKRRLASRFTRKLTSKHKRQNYMLEHFFHPRACQKFARKPKISPRVPLNIPISTSSFHHATCFIILNFE